MNGAKYVVPFNKTLFQHCALAHIPDDSTLNTSDGSILWIINSLSHVFTALPKCFYNNFIVLHPDKCFLMLLHVND